MFKREMKVNFKSFLIWLLLLIGIFTISFSIYPSIINSDNIKMMDEMMEKSKNNTKYTFNVCLNYGGQDEIIDVIKKIATQVQEGSLQISDIDCDTIEQNLYQQLPPIDLLIRTSGEYRISNFMLWQMAYAEFYFTDVLFPDFDEKELDLAIQEYQKRNRRFGGA